MKAMLACSTIPTMDQIKFPVLASPKLDGIRCLAIDGVAYSRTMKKIPNAYVQRMFAEHNLHGFDGELMVPGEFEDVASVIMSVTHMHSDKFYYNVFDYHLLHSIEFIERQAEVEYMMSYLCLDWLRLVKQTSITNELDLKSAFRCALSEGYEGLIIRDPKGPYKQGRSTMNQGWMLKLKLFKDAEATIIGFEELMHNDDTSTNKKENQVPGDTLGALIVRSGDVEFKIGSGFDTQQRDEIWQRRDFYINKRVTYKYQQLTKYGKPRFPTYKAVRPDE